MKYTPLHYAKAFRAAVAAHPHDKEKLVKNFAKLIANNGDAAHASKILAATEKLLCTVTGARSITFVTARPSSEPLMKIFHKVLKAPDIVRETVDPTLIGGVKILIDDELQFDASLRRKLGNLFGDL